MDQDSPEETVDQADGPIEAKIIFSKEDFEDLTGTGAVEEESGNGSLYELLAKKTATQGLMDVSLILANANQLRYNVEFNRNVPSFYVNVILLSISMTLQVFVAMVLIFKGHYYLRGQSKTPKARMVKRWCFFGVFLISFVNVLITALSKIEDKD